MEWIKVTPETMPPDMESVIVTAEYKSMRYVLTECRWNSERKCFEIPFDDCIDYWEDVDDKITHWMPIPEPAED